MHRSLFVQLSEYADVTYTHQHAAAHDAPAAVRGFRPAHRACVRPYVTEGATSRKWRHSPRIDHDVLCCQSLRRGMRRVPTALSGVCKMHRVIGRVYCKRAKINRYRP